MLSLRVPFHTVTVFGLLDSSYFIETVESIFWYEIMRKCGRVLFRVCFDCTAFFLLDDERVRGAKKRVTPCAGQRYIYHWEVLCIVLNKFLTCLLQQS